GVSSAGTAPLYFQWRQNGSLIGGATSSVYAISSVTTNDAGNYDVIVSNTVGSITSAAATLTVLLPPSISVQPVDVTVPTGGVANFFVTASGTTPLFYQWVKGTPIVGATAANYTIASATLADAGTFFVIVSNAVGSVTSATANLAVLIPPSITTQPIGGPVMAGGTTSLNAAATGSAPLDYQWRRNGVPIPGAISVTYIITFAQLSDTGNYDMIVTNAVGAATSSVAVITVLGAPQITSDPSSRGAWDGMDVVFTATAIGTAPLSRQWQYNNTDIPNETNAALRLTGVSTSQAGRYGLIVSNPYGAVTSAPALLVVRSGAATGLRNDFDGDGKTDFALTGPVSSRWVRTVYVRGQWRTFVSKRHPISSAWFLMQSTAGYRSQEFGWTTDLPIPGDYDGDKSTDLAIYRPDTATWYIIDSSSGAMRKSVFGRPGAVPVSGDFDRDGITDIAFYDRNTGNWNVQRSSDGSVHVQNWGWADALPVPGDYDGDATTDLAVYDTSAGDWYILLSGNGQVHRQNWGWSGVDPTPGDYDGDGITDLAVYDPANGVWYIQRSDAGTVWRQAWGGPGGVPVPGDYDGDAIIDIAIYDPVLSRWSILKSSDGQPLGGGPLQFGSPDTKPAVTQP
ncbi:MAG: immunoglobulin domain-containing protein, partial [bacterium]